MNYIANFFNIVLFEVVNFYWKKLLKKCLLAYKNSFIFIRSIFSKFQIEGNLIEFGISAGKTTESYSFSNNKFKSNGILNNWKLTVNYNDGIPILNIDNIHFYFDFSDIPLLMKKTNQPDIFFQTNLNSLVLTIIDEILNELLNRLVITINKIVIETSINKIDYKFEINKIVCKKVDSEITIHLKEIKLNNFILVRNLLSKNGKIDIRSCILRLETLLYFLELNKVLERFPELFIGNSKQNFEVSISTIDIKLNHKICLISLIENLTFKEKLEIEKIQVFIANKTIKVLEIEGFNYNGSCEIDLINLLIGNRRIKLINRFFKSILLVLGEHFPKIPKESPILTPQIRPISFVNSPYIEPINLVSNYLENIDEDLLGSIIELRENVSENFPISLIVNKIGIEVFVTKEIENNWEIDELIMKKLVGDFIVETKNIKLDNRDYIIETNKLKYRSINESINVDFGIIKGKANGEMDIECFKIFYNFIDICSDNYRAFSLLVDSNYDKIKKERIKSIEFSNTKLVVSYNPNIVKFYEILIGNYYEMVNLCNIEEMEIYISDFKVYRPNNFQEFLKKYLNHIISELKNRNWDTIISNSPLKTIQTTTKLVMNIPEVYNRIMRILTISN